jgi:hypothetical protein
VDADEHIDTARAAVAAVLETLGAEAEAELWLTPAALRGLAAEVKEDSGG